MLENFQALFSPFISEPGYISLLDNIRFFLEQSATFSRSECHSFRMLLESVFVDGPLQGGLTPLEGYVLSSHLLFLRNQPLDTSTLLCLREDAKNKTHEKLVTFRQQHIQKIEQLSKIGVYNPIR